MSAVTLLNLLVAVGALGGIAVWTVVEMVRISRAESFRVTNRRTGKTAIVSSRADLRKLIEVMEG